MKYLKLLFVSIVLMGCMTSQIYGQSNERVFDTSMDMDFPVTIEGQWKFIRVEAWHNDQLLSVDENYAPMTEEMSKRYKNNVYEYRSDGTYHEFIMNEDRFKKGNTYSYNEGILTHIYEDVRYGANILKRPNDEFKIRIISDNEISREFIMDNVNENQENVAASCYIFERISGTIVGQWKLESTKADKPIFGDDKDDPQSYSKINPKEFTIVFCIDGTFGSLLGKDDFIKFGTFKEESGSYQFTSEKNIPNPPDAMRILELDKNNLIIEYEIVTKLKEGSENVIFTQTYKRL